MKKFILVSSVLGALVLSFIPLFANAVGTQTFTVSKGSRPTTIAINMTAEDFKFTPSVINAHVGDTIKITLTGKDNKHSFSLSTFNVNVSVTPGQTKTFSFKVTKKGTFTFRCGVPCGSGHHDMTGTIIVS